MAELTPRQIEIRDLIVNTVNTRGYPPTVREIGEKLGLKSSATVHSHMMQLVRKGVIVKEPGKVRAIRVVE